MVVILVICTLLLGLIIAAILHFYAGGRKSDTSLPPIVTPSLPLLGNALDYKKAPHMFMFNATKRYGAIFRINLAGLKTTIVTTESGMKQLALAPEAVLSSRQAVSDFGFLYTLGELNVTEGAAFHKHIVKNYYFRESDLSGKAQSYQHILMRVVEDELERAHRSAGVLSSHVDKDKDTDSYGATKVIPDFLYFTRRVFVVLNTIDFLGPKVLQKYNASGGDLTSEFLHFQDKMEDAIAQATILPKALALPLFLEPVQKLRGAIVRKLAAVIEETWVGIQEGCEGVGVWLMEINTNNQRLRSNSSMSEVVGSSNVYRREFSATEAAELCCGLLFASHKNPSLAASQTVLFILEQHAREPEKSILELASAEAIQIMNSANKASAVSAHIGTATEMKVLHNCVYDTLRLTAHVIGSVRKVMSPGGFTINITDAESIGDAENMGETVSYTLPCGSYISESHFVPNCLRVCADGPGSKLVLPRFELDYERVQRNSAGEFNNDYEFTTFSHGVHKCVGQQLTVMMNKLYIAIILSKYHLSTRKPLSEISFERATLAQRKDKCEVCFTLR